MTISSLLFSSSSASLLFLSSSSSSSSSLSSSSSSSYSPTSSSFHLPLHYFFLLRLLPLPRNFINNQRCKIRSLLSSRGICFFFFLLILIVFFVFLLPLIINGDNQIIWFPIFPLCLRRLLLLLLLLLILIILLRQGCIHDSNSCVWVGTGINARDITFA